MFEAWMPAVFATVIVIGMVTAQTWRTLLSEGLPLLRDWARDRNHGARRMGRTDNAVPGHPELARRVEHLEEQVDFLESLLQQTRGPSTRVVRNPAAPSEEAAACGEQRSSSSVPTQ